MCLCKLASKSFPFPFSIRRETEARRESREFTGWKEEILNTLLISVSADGSQLICTSANKYKRGKRAKVRSWKVGTLFSLYLLPSHRSFCCGSASPSRPRSRVLKIGDAWGRTTEWIIWHVVLISSKSLWALINRPSLNWNKSLFLNNFNFFWSQPNNIKTLSLPY